jgi:peptide methionine sulfoxide reductase MsrA
MDIWDVIQTADCDSTCCLGGGCFWGVARIVIVMDAVIAIAIASSISNDIDGPLSRL